LPPAYIDFEKKTRCLRRHLVKNRRNHLFPIGALTARLLSKVQEPSLSTAFIFPARGNAESTFNGWSKSKAALDEISGITAWTLHDLRRTFATGLAGLGVPIHVVEKLLDHVSGTTGGLVGVYNATNTGRSKSKPSSRWSSKVPGADIVEGQRVLVQAAELFHGVLIIGVGAPQAPQVLIRPA
jgi:integrase